MVNCWNVVYEQQKEKTMTTIPHDLILSMFKSLTNQYRTILDMKPAWSGKIRPKSKWHKWWRLLIAASNAEKKLREDGYVGCIYGMLESCPTDAPIVCTHCEGIPYAENGR